MEIRDLSSTVSFNTPGTKYYNLPHCRLYKRMLPDIHRTFIESEFLIIRKYKYYSAVIVGLSCFYPLYANVGNERLSQRRILAFFPPLYWYMHIRHTSDNVRSTSTYADTPYTAVLHRCNPVQGLLRCPLHITAKWLLRCRYRSHGTSSCLSDPCQNGQVE